MKVLFFKKGDVHLSVIKNDVGYVRSIVAGNNDKAMLSIEIFDYDLSNETWEKSTKKEFEVNYDGDFKRLERSLREIGI